MPTPHPSNKAYSSDFKPRIIDINPGIDHSEYSGKELTPVIKQPYQDTTVTDFVDLNTAIPAKSPADLSKKKGIFGKIGSFLKKNQGTIRAIFGILFIGGVIAGTWLSIWLVDIWNNKSSLAGLGQEPNQSSVVYARDGKTEIFRYFDEENRQVVPLENISEDMRLAIIALEDENFYYNDSGIPWSNIAGAAFQCALSTGDNCRGGSGLSQQLIKNVKNDNETTIDRKVRELFTALKLNQEISKDEILERYLNWVPFGRNAYGIQQASQVYFDKDASELDAVESCYLASMVQRPSYFNSGIGNPDSQAFKDLEGRKNACLFKMYEVELVPGGGKRIQSEEELEELQNREVTFIPAGSNVNFPHFKDFVDQEIEKFINPQDLLTGGYTIITTLDPNIQTSTEQIVSGRAQSDINSAGGNNAGVIVLDGPTSEIIAMVGSLDYNNPSIDGQVNVTTAPRQPGSSIKPYVYASSFKKGLNPGSVLLDVQTTFEPGYTPRNFSGTFVGSTTIRSSLANSYNIPAVKAAYLSSDSEIPDASAGITEVFNTAEAMGLEFPCIPSADGNACNDPRTAQSAYRSRCGVSAALGGCEVTMLSHATAMNTFAQDGKLHQATPFVSIKDRSGNDIYKTRQESANPVYRKNDRAIEPTIARQINNIMSDYAARRPAFGNLASSLELPGWTGENSVAAKTGTTNNVKDTWTVGYSPYYTVTVWVGNTDGTPLNQNANSVSTTSGIWQDTMIKLHEGKEKRGFSREGLQPIGVNRVTGFPSEDQNRVTEWLTENQINQLRKAEENLNKPAEFNPREKNFHDNLTTVVASTLKINKLDGKLAVEGKTLPENIEEKQFFQLVAEYPAWQNTANALMERSPANYLVPPTEESDQDQVAEQQKAPLITSNLDNNKSNIKEITASAQPQGLSNKQIVKLEILIEGSMVQSAENSSILTFSDWERFEGRTVQVLIRASDNFGSSTEKIYTGVSFAEIEEEPEEPVELTHSDVAELNIQCSEPDDEDTVTSCSFEIRENTTLPSTFRVRIGNSTPAQCRSSSSDPLSFTCDNVALPSEPNSYPIQARIGANPFVNTINEFERT